MSFAPFIAVPLFLIGGCVYLVMLVAAGCAVAALFRKLRHPVLVTLLLHRGAVEPDGKPLEDWEIPAFASIQRNWDRPAPEPEYDTEGER